jgi:hypothetical protein
LKKVISPKELTVFARDGASGHSRKLIATISLEKRLVGNASFLEPLESVE